MRQQRSWAAKEQGRLLPLFTAAPNRSSWFRLRQAGISEFLRISDFGFRISDFHFLVFPLGQSAILAINYNPCLTGH
jgi:hypothetical protein